MPQRPSQEEVLSYFDTLSNWGRWGKEDTLGTLNLVTAEKRRQAAALVRDGESLSCSRLILHPGAGALAGANPQVTMIASGERYSPGVPGEDDPNALQVAMESLTFAFHGQIFTHIDGLGHVFWKGQMYNGRSSRLITTREGALVQNIEVLRNGIFTRGVLLDVARLRGKPWLDAAEQVYPEDLEACEQVQGVRVEAGDVVLLRTGYCAQLAPLPAGAPRPAEHSGWQAACLPWLRERGAAVIGSDVINDARPTGYTQTSLPVHQVALVAMGLRLIDNADLEALSEACSQRGRYEFCFTLNPLRLERGTGSPANPIATF